MEINQSTQFWYAFKDHFIDTFDFEKKQRIIYLYKILFTKVKSR